MATTQQQQDYYQGLASPIEGTGTTHEPSLEPSHELAAGSLELPTNNAANATNELKSAATLAVEYGVTTKAVQGWVKTVREAYCWLDPNQLVVGVSAKTRYTPLCQTLIAEYRQAAQAMSREDWIESVRAAHPDKLDPTPTNPVELSPTEVMPSENQPQRGLALHTQVLPLSVMPHNNEATYLSYQEQQQARFLALKAEQLEKLNQQYKDAQVRNAQFQTAADIDEALLMQGYELKGMTLAYQAAERQRQAFNATMQMLQSGIAPEGVVPGKPDSTDSSSQ